MRKGAAWLGAATGVVLIGMSTGIVMGQTPGGPPMHGGAMPPMKFTNLQILPKDISQQNLMKTMHGYSESLGVHCTFCHEGDPATRHMDFASDAKPEKKAARVMMTMTQTINEKYLAELADDHDAAAHEHHDDGVTCYTCHRGHAHPESEMPHAEEMPPAPPQGLNGGRPN